MPVPGKEVQIVAAVDADMEGYEVVHVTQIALGAEPAKGPHTIFISTEGEMVKRRVSSHPCA